MRSMSEQEASEYIKRIEEHTKDFTPKDSLRLLVMAGICAPTGRLTKPYREDKNG